ncbi:MAG: hypothetical protein KC502_14760 [Myxococcales bacterium]|nr:hypothetical protein [Myxococcales bacterium]
MFGRDAWTVDCVVLALCLGLLTGCPGSSIDTGTMSGANGAERSAPNQTQCDLTIAPGKLPTAQELMLPGESTACHALGLVSCRVSGDCGGIDLFYDCVRDNGKPRSVQWHTQEGDWPCTPAQLKHWEKQSARCHRIVHVSALKSSPYDALLDASKLPATVCANADGTGFWFVAECAMHHIWLEEPVGTCSNGARTGAWKFTIEPPTTAALRVHDLPFLACDSVFSALGCGYFRMETTANVRQLQLGGCGYIPCTHGVPDALPPQLLTAFTTCGADYGQCPGS